MDGHLSFPEIRYGFIVVLREPGVYTVCPELVRTNAEMIQKRLLIGAS